MIKKIIYKYGLICMLFIILTGCADKSNMQENNDSKDLGAINLGAIKSIKIFNTYIAAINENDELYVVGSNYYGKLGLGYKKDEIIRKPTKAASNVKEIIDVSTRLMYIDNNNNLYRAGLDEMGKEENISLIRKNVKEYQTDSSDLCGLTLDIDNNLYAYSSLMGDTGCGIDTDYLYDYDYTYETRLNLDALFKDLKIKAKDVFSCYAGSGYIDFNNNMYVAKESNPEVYEKVLDNVKKVSNGYESYLYLILTNDNVAYNYSSSSDNLKLEKLTDGVMEISEQGNYFRNNDGYYIINAFDNPLIDENDSYGRYTKLKIDNIKELWFEKISTRGILIYLNNDNKVEVRTDKGNYIFENKIEFIDDIFNKIYY